MEHYEELGVSPDATTAEIRRSYLALARRFHPDRLGGAPAAERDLAAARMARINAAWAVLSDRTRRRAYDTAWRADDTTSAATIRDTGSTWTPYEEGDEYVDPRLLDDTPSGAPSLGRAFTFLPAGLAAAGCGAVAVGFVVNLGVLLALGLILLLAAGACFLMVPLLALFRSSRADREG